MEAIVPHRPPGLVGFSFGGAGSVVLLQAVVVIDYQNVHLTGHELFSKGQGLAKHEDLVHPLHFANQLLLSRNQRQHAHRPHAAFEVGAGLPR